MYYKLSLLFSFLLSSLSPLYADHALALHGAPKYDAAKKVFDYVNPNAPKGGELKLALLGSFDHISPYTLTSTGGEGIFLVYDSLLKRSLDEPFSCYGRIAKSIDLNPDESVVVFTLRPEARFHNNEPLTAEDVAATYHLIRNKGPFTLKQAFQKIAKVEVLSSTSIKFTFAEKGQRQLALMLGFMPILFHKEIIGQPEDNIQQLRLTGNGPYKIARYQKGKYIEYKRVADYWAKDLPINKGHYNFDTIKFEYFRNYETAFQAFKAGEIDIFHEEDIGNWLKNYNFSATRRGDVQLREIPRTTSGMTGFVFNTRKPFLSHLNVRKALTLALDLNWLNKTYFHNAYEPITSYFQNTPFEAQDKPSPHLKPREARHQAMELLRDNGFEVKKNKLIDPKSQNPLELEILIPTGPQERIALAYKKNLENLGLTVSVRTVDHAQYENRLTSFDYDIIFQSWEQTLAPSEEQLKYWGSLAAITEGTRNYAGISSPEIDKLIHKIILERDPQKLTPLVQELDRLLRMGYYVAPFLMKQRDTIAYWNKFGQPKVQPVSTFPLLRWWVTQTWWQQ